MLLIGSNLVNAVTRNCSPVSRRSCREAFVQLWLIAKGIYLCPLLRPVRDGGSRMEVHQWLLLRARHAACFTAEGTVLALINSLHRHRRRFRLLKYRWTTVINLETAVNTCTCVTLAVYDDLMLARSAVQDEWATVRTIYISARVWIILTFEPLTQLLIHCSACIVQTRRTCTGDDVGSEWWTTGCLMSRQAQTYTIINNLLYADNIVFSASKNVRYMLRNVRHPHSIMLVNVSVCLWERCIKL